MMSDIDWDAFEQQMADAVNNVETDTDIVDATTLTDIELLDRFGKIDAELRERSEMLHPRTDRGRELQSLRAALRVTLAERGLM